MTAALLLPALASILAVAAIGLGLFAIWRAQALAQLTRRRTQSDAESCQTAIAAVEKSLAALTTELHDFQRLAPSGGGGTPPQRSGLNLSKRSQVLRMHRNGDAPALIAAALEVPRQEVDLLIKVHRIVISAL